MLVPHEHGAYGQLAFPLATALAVGHPSRGAVALAVAVFAVFLAHESVLVLIGQRGKRAARERRGDAWRSLALFGGMAVVAAVQAAIAVPASARAALLVPAALAGVLGVLVALRRERTTAGESLVGVALSSVSIPVALAAGASLAVALTIASVFVIVFVTATICVRSIIVSIARTGGPTRTAAASVVLGGVTALLLLAGMAVLSPSAPVAALPVCAVGVALLLRPPAPRQLRAVGWTLVAATSLTALILIAALR
jgi:hypothetical protein